MESQTFEPSVENQLDAALPGDLRGHLAEIGPSQLLNLLRYARQTGMLRFYKPHVERSLFRGKNQDARPMPSALCGTIVFERGSVVRASATAEPLHLASVLYKAQKLDAQQVYLIRNRHDNLNEKALALTLINGNYVTQADIVNSIAQYSTDAVHEIMTWSDAFFAFEKGAQPEPNTLIVALDMQQLITDGAQRASAIRRLEQELPDLDIALRLVPNADQRYRDAQLSVSEWRVISYIQPGMTIRSIATQCQLSDAEIRQIVHRLLTIGLVERAGNGPRRGMRRHQ